MVLIFFLRSWSSISFAAFANRSSSCAISRSISSSTSDLMRKFLKNSFSGVSVWNEDGWYEVGGGGGGGGGADDGF